MFRVAEEEFIKIAHDPPHLYGYDSRFSCIRYICFF
jgi:hypothetical protein